MNILLINDDLPPVSIGGSGRIVWETAAGLKQRGHDVTILTAASGHDFPPERDGIRIRTIPKKTLRWAHYRSVFSQSRCEEVLKIIRDVQPDVIHAHDVAWQIGYRWIAHARSMVIRVVHTAHSAMAVSYGKVEEGARTLWLQDLMRARWTFNPLRNAFIRSQLKHCTDILCVSDALRTFLIAHGYPARTNVLHNGINLSFWKESTPQKEARAELDLPTDALVFLTAGRLGHAKGTDALLKALPTDAHLIASGTMPAHLAQSATSRVHIVKADANRMRTLYAACDVVVVPSLYLDPFPTVCLEAMACSRPVIATRLGGAKEAVEDGVTGWVLDPRNHAAFAERLAWCGSHRDELKQCGRAGRKHMEKEFSRELYLDRLMDVYQRPV